MIDEKDYESSFQMILDAGDARSNAMLAIKCAHEYKFEEAKEHLSQAELSLKKAHQLQTKMMQDEINGQLTNLSILLVHGQDHFAMATLALDLANESIYLNQKIQELESKEEK